MSRSTFKVFALLVGGLAFAGSLYGLYELWARPSTLGWTPQHLALPVTSFDDRVRVYVAGVPLEKALADGSLTYAAPETVPGPPLAASDVTASFDNVYQERASRIPALVAIAACAGASFVLFLVGLFVSTARVYDTSELTELHLRTT